MALHAGTKWPWSPPVCAERSHGPRWVIATSAVPGLYPSPGHAPCPGSVCVHIHHCVRARSVPCPRSRGGGDDGGGAYGLWIDPGLGRGPSLSMWGHQTVWSCSGLCPGNMLDLLSVCVKNTWFSLQIKSLYHLKATDVNVLVLFSLTCVNFTVATEGPLRRSMTAILSPVSVSGSSPLLGYWTLHVVIISFVSVSSPRPAVAQRRGGPLHWTVVTDGLRKKESPPRDEEKVSCNRQ